MSADRPKFELPRRSSLMLHSEPDRSVYGWLKRHAWLLTIAVAGIAAVGTWVNSLKPIAPANPPPSAATSSSAIAMDPEAKRAAERQARAEKLHKIELEKHPDATSFLFTDYEAPTDGGRRGWVYIYAATKNYFVELDRQSCSYPDGTHIVTDFEQRYTLMSCNFPSFMQTHLKGGEYFADALVTIRFFDSDQKVVGSFLCTCPNMLLSNPSFDVINRTLDTTVVSGAETFYGGPSARMPLIRNKEEYAVRTRTTFDANWEAIGFTRLSQDQK